MRLVYDLEDIHNSYYNGQYKQMVEQIDTFQSLHQFLKEITENDVNSLFSIGQINDIMLKYTAIKGI